MSSIVSTVGRRRGARLLAAAGATALGLGALIGIAPAAQADELPPSVISGTVTFRSDFVPDYNTPAPGPFGPSVYGMLFATDKADGPLTLEGGGAAPVGFGYFNPDFSLKTHRVSFGIADLNAGTPAAMTAAENYALVYFTPQEIAQLANAGPDFDPSKISFSYITNDGLRTTEFAKAGSFRVSQRGVRIDLDPRVSGKKPALSGTAKIGKRLKAKTGAWQPGGVKLSYRWLRNGKAIKNATKSSYKVTRADRGKRLSVRVTGKKAGYKTLTLTSSSKRVKKTR